MILKWIPKPDNNAWEMKLYFEFDVIDVLIHHRPRVGTFDDVRFFTQYGLDFGLVVFARDHFSIVDYSSSRKV